MSLVKVTDRGGDEIHMVQLADGYRAPKFFVPIEDVQQAWQNMPDFKCREDDVLLWTFPKAGVNWLFEIMSMLIHQKAERVKTLKVMTNLEAQAPAVIEAAPSPRILNTHFNYRYFPREIAEKNIKTVLCVRNPKDTAVSYYNQMCNMRVYNYAGKWENWLPCFINGEFEYGSHETFLHECEQAIREAKFPLHVVHYEDLKANGVEEITRMARFLGVGHDEQLIRDIEDLCSFSKMKDKLSKDVKKMMMKDNTEFFRKGEVGDWKNWFTVAQNETFDKIWNDRMASSSFKFRYEL